MSIPMLRLTLRRNWPLWLVFTLVMVFYQGIIASMYDPASMANINAMLSLLPGVMINAFGFEANMTSLTGFVVSFFYGFLINILTLFYTLVLSSGLITRLVDNGSISYLLTTPVSRARLATTQMGYLYGSLVLMYAAMGGLSVLWIGFMQPGLLDLMAYLRTIMFYCLLSCTIASFCLLVGSIVSTTRAGLGISAGVTVTWLLLQMIGNTGPKYAALKQLTPYGWVDAVQVMAGGGAVPFVSAVLLVLWAVMASAGYVVFTRRQMAV